MTVITDTMEGKIRESFPDLQEAKSGALIPIRGMSPHYLSTKDDHPENGLMKLFSREVDGSTYYIYIKRD